MADDVKIIYVYVEGESSEAEDQRHCFVRTGFLRALVKDERVVAAILACDQQTQLLACAKTMADTGDQLAHLAGLPGRHAFITFPDHAVRAALDRIELTTAHQRLFDEWQRACQAAPGLFQRVTPARLNTVFVPLVTQVLQLSWLWLVNDLKAHYEQRFWSLVLGWRTELRHCIRKDLDVAVGWRPEDTWRQAVQRYVRDLDAAAHAYTHVPDKRHATDGENLERWGGWVYALKVQRPPATVLRLAREWQPHRDARKDVRTGTATGERLLSLKP